MSDLPPAAQQLALHKCSTHVPELVPVDAPATLRVVTRNLLSEQLAIGGLGGLLTAHITTAPGAERRERLDAHIADNGDGSYTGTFEVPLDLARRVANNDSSQEARFLAHISYADVPLPGSPFSFSVRLCRVYTSSSRDMPPAFAPGVLHVIGTGFKPGGKYRNPVDAGLVTVQRSPEAGATGQARDAIAHQFRPGFLRSSSCSTGVAGAADAPASVTIDLGPGRTVTDLTHYCLRSGSPHAMPVAIRVSGLVGVAAEDFNGLFRLHAASAIGAPPAYECGSLVLWSHNGQWVITPAAMHRDRDVAWSQGVVSANGSAAVPTEVARWSVRRDLKAGARVAIDNRPVVIDRVEKLTRRDDNGNTVSTGKCRYHWRSVGGGRSARGSTEAEHHFAPVVRTASMRLEVVESLELSWRLEGSNDSCESWHVLHASNDDTSLTRAGLAEHRWPITAATRNLAYRHLRIVQTAPPRSPFENRLFLAGIELYGKLADLTLLSEAVPKGACVIS